MAVLAVGTRERCRFKGIMIITIFNGGNVRRDPSDFGRAVTGRARASGVPSLPPTFRPPLSSRQPAGAGGAAGLSPLSPAAWGAGAAQARPCAMAAHGGGRLWRGAAAPPRGTASRRRPALPAAASGAGGAEPPGRTDSGGRSRCRRPAGGSCPKAALQSRRLWLMAGGRWACCCGPP